MEWDGLDVGAERLRALRWLGPLAPEAVRRARRTERLVEEIRRSAGPDLGSYGTGFDPNRGASGWPTPIYEQPAGPPAPRGVASWLSADHWTIKLKWNGFYLTVEHMLRSCRVHTIDLAPGGISGQLEEGATATGQVVEAALLITSWAPTAILLDTADTRVIEGSVHFLDDRGYDLFAITRVVCPWKGIAEVLGSAGVPLSVLAVPCGYEAAFDMAKLLFPPRRQYTVIYGHVSRQTPPR
ncbi:hypothetical protein KDL01_16325 [Actinospica durhamensis]|uniref:Uncharacterized protein n=1 Tax=Actinospica durhamensis TaxID=1508375 RepID=A0A941IN09_9ACTN|nr:hypothetical protein [Actinospica durhamensis]MBR7834840.1 hypothetical protein [Actinospica durhamensis]